MLLLPDVSRSWDHSLMPSGMSEEEVDEVIAALRARGARTDCFSCGSSDWAGVDRAGIPNLQPWLDATHRDDGVRGMDAEDGGPDLIDWMHGLRIVALICRNCGLIRPHAPRRLGIYWDEFDPPESRTKSSSGSSS